MTNLKETMQALSADGYVIRSPQGHFAFTNKFYQEYTGEDIGVVPVSQAKSKTTVVVMPTKKEDARDAYIQFITECNVPKRAETSAGEVYNLNQYSEKGAKAFAKILQRVARGEIDMEILKKTTQLYYRSPTYKLKIGNFIGDGAWETHYLEMLESIERKTLKSHITNTIEHDKTGNSRYRLGGGSPNPAGQNKNIGGSPGKKPWDTNVSRPTK